MNQPISRIEFENHNHDGINSQKVKTGDVRYEEVELKKYTYNISVVDDGYIYLPTNISGWGIVTAQGEEGATFIFTSAGVPTIIGGSTNVVTTDTDVKLCILDNGDGIAIRNRLGATKQVKLIIYF